MPRHDHSGNFFVGSLERALRAGVGWATGWRYLGMILTQDGADSDYA